MQQENIIYGLMGKVYPYHRFEATKGRRKKTGELNVIVMTSGFWGIGGGGNGIRGGMRTTFCCLLFLEQLKHYYVFIYLMGFC